MSTTPIYDDLLNDCPPYLIEAMFRPPWSFAAALKAADEAIATKVSAQPKRPAKKRTPRKAS